MRVQISKEVSDDPQLQPLVVRANQLLEELNGPAPKSVSVDWTREVSNGGKIVNLALVEDNTGARGATVFAPTELTREVYLRAKLEKVWGDLLQDYSHRLLKRLLDADKESQN
jgi:hypothetical protein